MPLYRVLIGTHGGPTGHEITYLVIKAKNGSDAMKNANRATKKLNGILTYVGLMRENQKDFILYHDNKAEEVNEKLATITSIGDQSRGEDNLNSPLPVEGSPDPEEVG